MEYEVRDGRIHLTGYVNAVGRDSKEIFTQRGRCVEQIQPGAFERALRNNPEVRMKLNHKRDVQAELTLIEDTIGLKADAYTDDEEVMMLAEKGELRGWSFGFDAISDELEERRGKSPRRIVKELNLHEVSVLSIKPAYNGTSIEYRSEDAQAAQMRDEIAYRKAALCLAKRGVHIGPPRAREYRDADEGLTDDGGCGNIEVRDEQPREPAGTPQGGQFASENKSASIELPDTIKEDDIEIGRSLGAKAKNYDILDLKTGEHFSLAEGTHLQNVETFAGKGVKAPYNKAQKYAEKYGGKPEDWKHSKAIGEVDYHGETRKANLHFSQCEGVGKVDFFVKEWLE